MFYETPAYVEFIEEVTVTEPRTLRIPKGFQGSLVGDTEHKNAIVFLNAEFSNGQVILGAGNILVTVDPRILRRIERPQGFRDYQQSSTPAPQENGGYCMLCNQHYQSGSACPKDSVPLIAPKICEIDSATSKDGTVFAIRECVGRDKFAAVFKAESSSDKKSYAIKMAAGQSPVDDAERLGHLTKGYQLLKSANHPSIIKVVDCNLEANQPFFVMPYYDLQALSSACLTISIEDTLRTMRDVSEALIYLKEQKIEHVTQITSAQIFPGSSSSPAILFGLTRKEIVSHPNGTYSANGIISKDVSEYSLEGLTGKPLNEKSLVYNLGAITLRCLLHRPIFAGKNAVAQASQALSKPAPTFDGPEKLKELIASSLEKNPQLRPGLEEMNEGLKALCS